MPPPPHQKPENVLKRAHELIGVNQAPAALTLLHEHIISKRSRNVPIASLEPVMLLLVELSVDQKKGKLAKDALYQYKNISQNTNVATIELVLKRFIDLSVDKATAAQQKADEVQSSIEAAASVPTTSIDDLEATETPESLLLATVSGEQSRDRTDRAIVTPWLKFLWEAYRTVLDILRNNARLEILYQTTAMQAFEFCLKYARKTEFRRLCELLRNHVQTAAKYSSQMHAINLNEPDTLQRHLETRFQQLNVAVELELWQEAFRSVEDIHTLLNLSKRPPKNVMMSNYYEKLTRIFHVGENYLFHAAAWSRYYTLLRQLAAVAASGQNRATDNVPFNEADLQRAASFVLLSALAIPVISTSRSRGAMVDFDEAKKNKNSRLTHLLGLAQAPTRASLFRDALSKSLLRRVSPEIRELYNILEVDFHPLSICEKISPILVKIGADSDMEKYIVPLQQVILTRLFQQLSQVYETVDVSFVEGLAQFPEPYQVARATIEKFIMNGNKKGDLAIRMDHATDVLSFDNDVFSSSKAAHGGGGATASSAESEAGSVQRLQSTPSEIVRSQLSRLAKALYTTCHYVDPDFTKARVAAREAALIRARAGADHEHRDMLSRKVLIQSRKDEASELQARREKERAKQKLLREQAMQEAEDRRLAAEQLAREKQRLKAEIDKVKMEEMLKQIAELGGAKVLDIDMDKLDSLDPNLIRKWKLAQLERERSALNERLRVTGKRLDHLERAFRREEAKMLPEDYRLQTERDRATYEEMTEKILEDAEQKHKESVELKHRLSRLVSESDRFRASLLDRRRDEFERRRRDAERELEKQIATRKREFREKRLRERREREDREKELREAEEQAARVKEEQRQRDEATKAERQRQKDNRERERQESAEKAALQARREEEALARRRRGPTAALANVASPTVTTTLPSRPLEPMDSPDRARPPPIIGGGKWRERQAAILASGTGVESGVVTSVGETAQTLGVDGVPTRSETPIPRVDSSDRLGAGGPPRLQLTSGNKPSWREREAARTAAGSGAGGFGTGSGPRANEGEGENHHGLPTGIDRMESVSAGQGDKRVIGAANPGTRANMAGPGPGEPGPGASKVAKWVPSFKTRPENP